MRFVNYLIFGAVMLALFAGTSFAVTNVSISASTSQVRWAGTTTASSYATEGGNISSINISVTSLTDKWAAFYGSLTGTISLRDTVSTIFTWTYATSGGGHVCASTKSSWISGTLANASATTVNTLWSLGVAGVGDSATTTFTTTCPYTLTLNGQTITIGNSVGITHAGASTFKTCGIQDGTGAKTNYAFCTNISSAGTNFQGNSSNYELMVPTTPGTGLETYYLYAELS